MKQIQNQKENKKAAGKYVIIMIAAVVIGGIYGFFSVEITKFLEGQNVTPEMISIHCIRFFAVAAPYVMWIFLVAACSYTIFALKKGQKEFAAWDFEDEGVMDKIEMRLNIGIFLTSNLLFVDYFFFSAHILAIVKDLCSSGMMFLISVVGMAISMVLSIVLQQKIIDFVKEMNPEKKGSVYDLKFQKKWMDTCDEAEQLQIYKASYKAYRKVNSLCMTLFVIFFFFSVVFKTGLLPIAIVIGILAYSQLIYCMEATKEGWNNQHKNEKLSDNICNSSD